MRVLYVFVCALFFSSSALATPIELVPGLWKIESQESQNVSNGGQAGAEQPILNSELRCLDETSAWLLPSDYARSFNSKGCLQQDLISTPLDFRGVWACDVDGLKLTINMSGEASLTGDTYSTLMTVRGENERTSVNMQSSVTATRTGDCPS